MEKCYRTVDYIIGLMHFKMTFSLSFLFSSSFSIDNKNNFLKYFYFKKTALSSVRHPPLIEAFDAVLEFELGHPKTLSRVAPSFSNFEHLVLSLFASEKAPHGSSVCL